MLKLLHVIALLSMWSCKVLLSIQKENETLLFNITTQRRKNFIFYIYNNETQSNTLCRVSGISGME